MVAPSEELDDAASVRNDGRASLEVGTAEGASPGAGWEGRGNPRVGGGWQRQREPDVMVSPSSWCFPRMPYSRARRWHAAMFAPPMTVACIVAGVGVDGSAWPGIIFIASVVAVYLVTALQLRTLATGDSGSGQDAPPDRGAAGDQARGRDPHSRHAEEPSTGVPAGGMRAGVPAGGVPAGVTAGPARV